MKWKTNIAVALLLTVAACSTESSAAKDVGAKSSDDKKLMGRKDVVAEYQAKVKSYPWPLPSGYSFPEQPPTQQSNILSQAGVGVVYADSYFDCAWTAVFLLNRNKNKKKADAALGWIDKFYAESEFATKYLEPPGAENYRDNIIKKTRLGDASGIKEFFEGNGCPGRPGIPKII